MATQCRRQAIAAPEKINRAGLAVILREDGAIGALFRGELVPRLCGFGNDFVPAELIGVPLRQRGAPVLVFHDWKFERQTLSVGQEVIGRKNRDRDGRKVCTTGEQDGDHRRLEPRADGTVESCTGLAQDSLL